MRYPTRMIIHAFVVLTVAVASAQAESPLDPGAHGRDRAGGVSSLASHGNAHAQTVLGFMYENGRGVPQNFERAVEWYRRAAAQGDPTAQYLLGLMYDKGHGVQQDWVLAHKWLILAAGKATGQQREYYARIRDSVGLKLTPEQISEAQSLAGQWRPVRER
jgi:uncharacterized protein